jgi:hypothetical protein
VSGPTGFSVSENGVLAYRSGHEEVGRRLFWYSRDGVRTPAGGDLGYSAVRLSPDQNRVVLRRGDPNTKRAEMWVLELARGILSRVNIDPSFEFTTSRGVWSPDSRRIFARLKTGSKYEARVIDVASGATTLV